MYATYWLLLFVSAIISKYLVEAFRNDLRSPSRIPGPQIASFTKFYRVWLFAQGRGPLRYAELHQRYGTVVRTGPNHVSISKADVIPIIYDARQKFRKSNFYFIFRPLYQGAPMETAFTMADPHKQRLLKQPIVAHMTGLSPQQLSPAVDASALDLIRALSAREDQTLDFCKWSFYWAFDLTYFLLFGSYAGYMSTGTDFDGIITAFVEITRGGSLLGFVPEYCDWLLANDRTMTFLRKFQSFPDPTQVFLAIIQEKLIEHQSSSHECSGALICRVLADRDVSNKTQRDEAVNVLFEGFFAAAVEIGVSLNSIFHCLLTNPEECAKLVEELRTSSLAQCQSSEYLTAVIKESLRKYTSNSPQFERVVPHDLDVDGYVIPQGTIVGVPQYVVHRDASVYGDDVEVFRPERWLEADVEHKKLMERNFMPFGKGSRACAGRNLAMLELRTVIIGILRNFDVQLTDPAMPIGTRMYWLMEFTGMNVTFRRKEAV